MHENAYLLGLGFFGGGFVLFVLAAMASVAILALLAVFITFVGIIIDTQHA